MGEAKNIYFTCLNRLPEVANFRAQTLAMDVFVIE